MKPVMFIDNDFLNNVFGRGKSFSEEFGLAVLDTLKERYDIKITDCVFEEATHDTKWPKDRAVLKWLKENNIRPLGTAVEPGRDLGERSIVDAIENTNLPFDETIVLIASDDRKFFQPGGGGEQYVEMRVTADDAKEEALRIRSGQSTRAGQDKPWRKLVSSFNESQNAAAQSYEGAGDSRRENGKNTAQQDGQSAALPS